MTRLIVGVIAILLPIGALADEAVVQYRVTQHERGLEHAPKIVRGTQQVFLCGIQSKTGIGRMVISPMAGKWSMDVTLRMRLRGLESIQIDNGTTTIVGSVSSTSLRQTTYVTPSENAAKQELENKVDAQHPLYLQIQLVPHANRGKHEIPLDGYFDVKVPRAFLKDQPRSLSVQWIDFYRG